MPYSTPSLTIVPVLHAAVRTLQRDFRETHPGAFPCSKEEASSSSGCGRSNGSGAGEWDFVTCSRPYLALLQCDLALPPPASEGGGLPEERADKEEHAVLQEDKGGGERLAFASLRQAQTALFRDRSHVTGKDLTRFPYQSVVAGVRARALEALGIAPQDIVFKPHVSRDLDCLRVDVDAESAK